MKDMITQSIKLMIFRIYYGNSLEYHSVDFETHIC